jgi:hypothetical protein
MAPAKMQCLVCVFNQGHDFGQNAGATICVANAANNVEN